MSRIKNFIRNLAASYIQLAAGVVYSLVSIPLILHYLPKAEFGLWAMLVQLLGYVSLIDLGMTSAVARLLVDYKDRRSDGGYGSLVKTSFLVSAVQGAIILTVVLLASPALATLMKVPVEHAPTFINLMRWQGVIVAFGYCLRPLAMILYAHQREYVSTFATTITLVISLGLLSLLLRGGFGIYSFIYANIAGAVFTPVYLLWNCWKLGLLPRSGERGRVSLAMFKECFAYGKDVFLMGLGAQLITASQTIIVSRSLGLEIAATWAVGTKMFNLILPLMCRPYGAAIPGMYEMLARGETGRLHSRFREMVVLTGSLGVFFAVSFGLCNSLFITVWTNGRIVWSPLNDVLLAVWLFVSSLQTTHCNFVAVTKRFGGMRYIYFVEGVCFVLLALFGASRLGVPGIVSASILCTVVFSYQYGLRISRDYFHDGLRELAFEWVRPCLRFALMFTPLAVATWFAAEGLSTLPRLCVNASVALIVGAVLFLRIGATPEMLQEANLRLPRPLVRVLRFLAPCGA